MKQTKLQKTIELANLALETSQENLWINYLNPNSWEVVVLDQRGYCTNHKLQKNLNDKEILKWINKWLKNYEISKMWRTKQLTSQSICYT